MQQKHLREILLVFMAYYIEFRQDKKWYGIRNKNRSWERTSSQEINLGCPKHPLHYWRQWIHENYRYKQGACVFV